MTNLNNNTPGIHATASLGHLTPEQAAEGMEAVAMFFPRPITLTVAAHHNTVAYPAGIHQVPKELADHWFLRANGVRTVDEIALPVARKEAQAMLKAAGLAKKN